MKAEVVAAATDGLRFWGWLEGGILLVGQLALGRDDG